MRVKQGVCQSRPRSGSPYQIVSNALFFQQFCTPLSDGSTSRRVGPLPPIASDPGSHCLGSAPDRGLVGRTFQRLRLIHVLFADGVAFLTARTGTVSTGGGGCPASVETNGLISFAARVRSKRPPTKKSPVESWRTWATRIDTDNAARPSSVVIRSENTLPFAGANHPLLAFREVDDPPVIAASIRSLC